MHPASPPLKPAELSAFSRDGFIRLDNAFPRSVAEAGRAILWQLTGCRPGDRETWTQPVIRIGGRADPPFVEAANSRRLKGALDQIVGAGRWAPLMGLGTFPVRFPSDDPPGDDGWHIDVSFALPEDDPSDFLAFRANAASRGRALLMLFLFSDVGADDAPTRIRAGSHHDVAQMLVPLGETGATLRELAAHEFSETAHRPVVYATGEAGTVYLCHPFLVHAAQPNRGSGVKFMAQPPLLPRPGFDVRRLTSF